MFIPQKFRILISTFLSRFCMRKMEQWWNREAILQRPRQKKIAINFWIQKNQTTNSSSSSGRAPRVAPPARGQPTGDGAARAELAPAGGGRRPPWRRQSAPPPAGGSGRWRGRWWVPHWLFFEHRHWRRRRVRLFVAAAPVRRRGVAPAQPAAHLEPERRPGAQQRARPLHPAGRQRRRYN